jgi:hypothetical protein
VFIYLLVGPVRARCDSTAYSNLVLVYRPVPRARPCACARARAVTESEIPPPDLSLLLLLFLLVLVLLPGLNADDENPLPSYLVCPYTAK